MKTDMHKVKMALCIHTKIPHACLVQYSHMQQDGFRNYYVNRIQIHWTVVKTGMLWCNFMLTQLNPCRVLRLYTTKISFSTKKTSKITCTWFLPMKLLLFEFQTVITACDLYFKFVNAQELLETVPHTGTITTINYYLLSQLADKLSVIMMRLNHMSITTSQWWGTLNEVRAKGTLS